MRRMKWFLLVLMIGSDLLLSISWVQAETLKADIVVIGAGSAGMAAAVNAADGGAKVIVLEKMPFPGGASNLAMAVFNPDSKKTNEVFRELMEFSHWRANARLVRAYVDKAVSNREWFTQHGVEMIPSESAGMSGVQLKAEGQGHGGASMVKTLVARAKENGADIRLSTPAEKLILEKGRIAGVIAKDKDGKPIQVNAKAVIIATGGFVNNKDMLREYTGFSGDELFLMMDLKLTGDGIRMAWEAGAAKEGLGVHMIYNVPGPGIVGDMPWMAKNQVRVIQMQPHLWVNQRGERFFDEGAARNTTYTGNAIARQKGRCAYLIFDGSIRKKMEVGFDNAYGVFPGMGKLVDLDSQMKGLQESGNRNAFMADSLEELARKMQIDPNVLKETVAQYNRFCEKGHDDLFAKDPKFLRPVKEPKYYAFRVVPSAYGTFGGIKVNEKMEVLNQEQDVIPGLYAAGYDAHIIFGDTPDYDWKVSGSGLGFAVASGRIAGESVLKYLGK